MVPLGVSNHRRYGTPGYHITGGTKSPWRKCHTWRYGTPVGIKSPAIWYPGYHITGGTKSPWRKCHTWRYGTAWRYQITRDMLPRVPYHRGYQIPVTPVAVGFLSAAFNRCYMCFCIVFENNTLLRFACQRRVSGGVILRGQYSILSPPP